MIQRNLTKTNEEQRQSFLLTFRSDSQRPKSAVVLDNPIEIRSDRRRPVEHFGFRGEKSAEGEKFFFFFSKGEFYLFLNDQLDLLVLEPIGTGRAMEEFLADFRPKSIFQPSEKEKIVEQHRIEPLAARRFRRSKTTVVNQVALFAEMRQRVENQVVVDLRCIDVFFQPIEFDARDLFIDHVVNRRAQFVCLDERFLQIQPIGVFLRRSFQNLFDEKVFVSIRSVLPDRGETDISTRVATARREYSRRPTSRCPMSVASSRS